MYIEIVFFLRARLWIIKSINEGQGQTQEIHNKRMQAYPGKSTLAWPHYQPAPTLNLHRMHTAIDPMGCSVCCMSPKTIWSFLILFWSDLWSYESSVKGIHPMTDSRSTVVRRGRVLRCGDGHRRRLSSSAVDGLVRRTVAT